MSGLVPSPTRELVATQLPRPSQRQHPPTSDPGLSAHNLGPGSLAMLLLSKKGQLFLEQRKISERVGAHNFPSTLQHSCRNMQCYTWSEAGFPLSHWYSPRSGETGVSFDVTQAQAHLLLDHLLQPLHQGAMGARATELWLELHCQHLPLLFECLLDDLQEFSSPVEAGIRRFLKLEQEAWSLHRCNCRLEKEPP